MKTLLEKYSLVKLEIKLVLSWIIWR